MLALKPAQHSHAEVTGRFRVVLEARFRSGSRRRRPPCRERDTAPDASDHPASAFDVRAPECIARRSRPAAPAARFAVSFLLDPDLAHRAFGRSYSPCPGLRDSCAQLRCRSGGEGGHARTGREFRVGSGPPDARRGQFRARRRRSCAAQRHVRVRRRARIDRARRARARARGSRWPPVTRVHPSSRSAVSSAAASRRSGSCSGSRDRGADARAAQAVQARESRGDRGGVLLWLLSLDARLGPVDGAVLIVAWLVSPRSSCATRKPKTRTCATRSRPLPAPRCSSGATLRASSSAS